VIDATGAPAKPDMTVVVRGDRIEALGKTGKLTVPQNMQVVNATGKFIIPGLWDMHAHLQDLGLGKGYLALFIANGVTGVRVMSGREEYYGWRQEISSGKLIGPRMVIGSPILTGPTPSNYWVVVTNEGEGRQLVRKFKKEGADFIKVYSWLPRDVYFAIADEAKKQGIPFVGHVPLSVTTAEASDAGERSIEHTLTDIIPACSTSDECELKTKFRTLWEAESPNAGGILANSSYSERKAMELFARLVTNKTWVCPTLIAQHGGLYLDNDVLMQDPRLKYIPPNARKIWTNYAGEARPDYEKLTRMQLKIVGDMRLAGVGLLAGTDTPIAYCFPGFALHDELELLVRAGLSPMEALRTATYNPAKFFNQLDSMGTVERGKVADLVLLDANPLQDIRNTQRIAAVVAGGRIFQSAALQKMLAQVEAQAKEEYLCPAAANGEIERVKLLISEDADVNVKDSYGLTPLHYAAREGHKEIVELLLEHGADVNISEANFNNTAAEFAMTNNHTDIVQLLVSKDADISPLHFALYMKDEIKARSLIEGGADVSGRTPNGTEPLNRAVIAGLKDIAELLIAKGADVNAKGPWNWTPLHSAVHGSKDIVELLITEGANVNARDGGNRTPLWYAKNEGNAEIVELLRKHGAKEDDDADRPTNTPRDTRQEDKTADPNTVEDQKPKNESAGQGKPGMTLVETMNRRSVRRFRTTPTSPSVTHKRHPSHTSCKTLEFFKKSPFSAAEKHHNRYGDILSPF
jgi:ankyrin repeat protein